MIAFIMAHIIGCVIWCYVERYIEPIYRPYIQHYTELIYRPYIEPYIERDIEYCIRAYTAPIQGLYTGAIQGAIYSPLLDQITRACRPHRRHIPY